MHFYFSNPKLCQERLLLLSVRYTDLCTVRSTEEAVDSFFSRAI